MYTKIGAFDAKSKLSELLQDVQQGERYTITLRGEPIADLIPTESNNVKNTRIAVKMMRGIKKIRGVSGKTIAEWINEGKR